MLTVRTGESRRPGQSLLTVLIIVDLDGNPRASPYAGYHRFTIRGDDFDVDQRYTALKPIGGGAYGVVCSADDKVSSPALSADG